jgi:hypothetical protein
MIQLTYEPAFDPFNAVFRLARLTPLISEAGALDEDYVRILDFYQLFPFRIDEIKLKLKDRKYKKLATKYDSTKPYGQFPSGPDVFQRMKPAQVAALDTFATGEWIKEESLHRGMIEPTGKRLPERVWKKALEANEQQEDLVAFLKLLASEYDLLGLHGLKARTGLLEYRYDAV